MNCILLLTVTIGCDVIASIKSNNWNSATVDMQTCTSVIGRFCRAKRDDSSVVQHRFVMEESSNRYREEDPNSWKEWARSMLIWAAQDPWTFVFNIFLILSPLLFVSLYLSYKLSRDIDNQKKDKKKKIKRDIKGKKKKNKDG